MLSHLMALLFPNWQNNAMLIKTLYANDRELQYELISYVLMLSTCGVNAQHILCGCLAPVVRRVSSLCKWLFVIGSSL